MHLAEPIFSLFRVRDWWRYLLVLSWVIGLLSGMFYATGLGDLRICKIEALQNSSLPFVGFFIRIIPLALCALFSSIAFPSVSLLILTIEGFIYGICSCILLQSFSSGGWLVQILLMFSHSVSCVVLFVFLFLRTESISIFRRNVLICVVLDFFVCLLQHNLISPFILSLL